VPFGCPGGRDDEIGTPYCITPVSIAAACRPAAIAAGPCPKTKAACGAAQIPTAERGARMRRACSLDPLLAQKQPRSTAERIEVGVVGGIGRQTS